MSHDSRTDNMPADAPECLTFMLMPGFSMLAFVSAIEPLRVANRMSQKQLFKWQVLSTDGLPVTASNGMTVVADTGTAGTSSVAALFVCAGFQPLADNTAALRAWLRRMAAYGTTLGAIDTGCFLLAEAGLLGGYRVTLHWESLSAFAEAYPAMEVTQELFEFDRNRMTCSGGTAAMDMMLHLIARSHDHSLAVAVSEQFIRDRIRDRCDSQRAALRLRLNIHDRHVLDTVALMERHVEDPLPAQTLAQRNGISLRQLQRLFNDHLGTTPQRYYLSLRLTHARRLLQQTSMQILAVALACGFKSAAPFSRAYKAHFGITPRQDRQSPMA